MRSLVFFDLNACMTVDKFNKWAEGKYMTKDVIIHTHTTSYDVTGVKTLMIIVFFDEGTHPSWVGKA